MGERSKVVVMTTPRQSTRLVMSFGRPRVDYARCCFSADAASFQALLIIVIQNF